MTVMKSGGKRSKKAMAGPEERIVAAESKVDEMFDTARVKAELAKMNARDVAMDLGGRYERLRGRFDGYLRRSNAELANGLKRLSDACLGLRKKLTQE